MAAAKNAGASGPTSDDASTVTTIEIAPTLARGIGTTTLTMRRAACRRHMHPGEVEVLLAAPSRALRCRPAPQRLRSKLLTGHANVALSSLISMSSMTWRISAAAPGAVVGLVAVTRSAAAFMASSAQAISATPWCILKMAAVDSTDERNMMTIMNVSGGFAMAQMGRPGLSSQQKHELWARWKAGQSLSDIGRSLDKHAGSIFGVLHSRGGIAPPARRRSPRSLSVREREEISRGLVSGLSLRLIAAQLGRAPSTISREVGRKKGRRKYRAANADERTWRSACRPKPCRLAVNRSLHVKSLPTATPVSLPIATPWGTGLGLST